MSINLPSCCRIRRVLQIAHATRYRIADSHAEVRCLFAAMKFNGCLVNNSPTVKDVKLARSPHALLLIG